MLFQLYFRRLARRNFITISFLHLLDIQCRMISFWARINEDVEENERKLSNIPKYVQ